jgi:hypothetical protein
MTFRVGLISGPFKAENSRLLVILAVTAENDHVYLKAFGKEGVRLKEQLQPGKIYTFTNLRACTVWNPRFNIGRFAIEFIFHKTARLEAVAEEKHAPIQLVQSSEDDVYELLSTFECPICMDHMFPPFLQCNNGHMLCNDCLRKIKDCPICRGRKREFFFELGVIRKYIEHFKQRLVTARLRPSIRYFFQAKRKVSRENY